MMFLTTIAWGANLFITIIVILIAFGAGLTITDFLNTKEKEKSRNDDHDAGVTDESDELTDHTSEDRVDPSGK